MSAKSKFTPGPWQAEGFRVREVHRDFSYGIWKDGVRLALVDCRPLAKRSEEEANARLIAAAPELMAALQELLAVVDHENAYGAIEARIAKIARLGARAALDKAGVKS